MNNKYESSLRIMKGEVLLGTIIYIFTMLGTMCIVNSATLGYEFRDSMFDIYIKSFMIPSYISYCTLTHFKNKDIDSVKKYINNNCHNNLTYKNPFTYTIAILITLLPIINIIVIVKFTYHIIKYYIKK